MKLLVRFQVLLLSALSAHVLSGGTLAESSNLLWQGFCIATLLFGLKNIKLEGPGLALLILFIQSSSHFILGAGTYQSELRMTLAHLLSGVMSYLAISYFDICWDFIASVLIALVPKKTFLKLSLPETLSLASKHNDPTFQIRKLTASLKFRGPPLAWGK